MVSVADERIVKMIRLIMHLAFIVIYFWTFIVLCVDYYEHFTQLILVAGIITFAYFILFLQNDAEKLLNVINHFGLGRIIVMLANILLYLCKTALIVVLITLQILQNFLPNLLMACGRLMVRFLL